MAEYVCEPIGGEGLPPFTGELTPPLRTRENVFAFSMSCAGLQKLQMLSLVLSPLDRPNPGSQLYQFVGGFLEEPFFGSRHPNCVFQSVIAKRSERRLLSP
jgi:hypothetical protein